MTMQRGDRLAVWAWTGLLVGCGAAAPDVKVAPTTTAASSPEPTPLLPVAHVAPLPSPEIADPDDDPKASCNCTGKAACAGNPNCASCSGKSACSAGIVPKKP